MMDIITEKKILLLQSQLFSKLREEELEIIVRYSEFIYFQSNEVVFRIHDPARSLYLIADGEILITKTESGADERDVAKYLSGECFGELSLFRSSRQNANAIAVLDSRILQFPAASFKFWDIAEMHGEVFANILYKLIAIIAGRIRRTNRLINDRTPWLHELKRNLYTDKLTGIFNKNYLDEDLPEGIYNMDIPVCLLMVKPDNFKQVNDTFGHDAGDRVLRLITIFIQSLLKEEDIAVRYRGDEFVVVLTGTSLDRAIIFSRDMQQTLYAMDLSNALQTGEFHVTVSIGISIFPGEANNAEDLIKQAHARMMTAWEAGGNSIQTGVFLGE
ncbi:MAG: hypothetical protein CVV44_23180 [Spirochaetae bacterium HGW-Spirochaetae-1]|jgi:diguanylate cyclase (GGDEF)-like protein|nr:MAG: hypothetical protein CVV44_23180 [Spirochaetae bacterium HGW-Spirochaetae-1]